MAPAPRRKLVDANVTDALKRRYPSKHYVYVIQVTWDDGSQTTIFRRYSKFFDFQISLLESFPKEAGLKDPSTRIIPFLPGKILFRRSHIRDVAMKRLKPIDEYCKALIQLPCHISQSCQVLDFFESKPEDVNPPKDETSKKRKKDESVKRRPVRRTKSLEIGEISGPITLEEYVAVADYTRAQPKELSVTAGQHLEVIEKHENGWWFVSDEEGERGWVPGVHLEKQDGSHEDLITKESELGYGEKYITTAKFVANNPDEVSFGLGVLVEVLQKNLEGWWRISYQNKQGLAPASYLEKAVDVVLRHGYRNEHGVEIISSVNDIKTHRRSLPSGTINAILPSPASALSMSNSASSSPKHNDAANRRCKDDHSACISSAASLLTKPRPQVRPPPKRSSVNRGSIVLKPQVPPPLPPSISSASEPIYDYVAKSSFNADIPNGISFERDVKMKVIEKSPGGWWYIDINGSEGWAPSSCIEKQFKSKERQPPERPKLPKSSIKPSLVSELKGKSSLARSNSAGSTSRNKDIAKIISARRPLLPKPGQCAASQSSAAPDPGHKAHSRVKSPQLSGRKQPFRDETSTNDKVARDRPSVLPVKSGPSKTETKEAEGATTNFRSSLRPAAVGKKNSDAGNRYTGPPKRPLRPTFSAERRAASNATTTVKKQPAKPPAPPMTVKKPASRAKSDEFRGVGAGAAKTDSAKGDFRSVLKSQKPPNADLAKPGSAANKKVPTPKTPPKPGPPTKGKPAAKSIAASNQSSVTSLRSKFAGSEPVHASKPKPPISRAKPAAPSNKPVLRRFQNDFSNGNNCNNNDDAPTEDRVVVVGRVEMSTVAPSAALPVVLRGSPDGQVDEATLSESFYEKCKSTIHVGDDLASTEKGTKYVAVANFVPENSTEIAFRKGSEALLIEVAKNDWWYVNIDGEHGWVPSAFFEQLNEEPPLESAKDAPKIVRDSSPDAIYSEIDDYCISDLPPKYNRCVSIASFAALDDTMLSIEPGDIVEVVEEADTGWWYVCVVYSIVSEKGQEGWVPADHLQHL